LTANRSPEGSIILCKLNFRRVADASRRRILPQCVSRNYRLPDEGPVGSPRRRETERLEAPSPLVFLGGFPERRTQRDGLRAPASAVDSSRSVPPDSSIRRRAGSRHLYRFSPHGEQLANSLAIPRRDSCLIDCLIQCLKARTVAGSEKPTAHAWSKSILTPVLPAGH